MYDYIIIGSGSAGCVVASRLGEDRDVRILVIEAGPPEIDPQIQVPLAFGTLLKTRYDWDFASEPEPGLDERRNYIPRGRVVGGSGSLNAMIYMRGNQADYDEWAALGFEGWAYDDVLPYFRRSEDNVWGESVYHGAGGPLTVSNQQSPHAFTELMIEAARDAGIPANNDPNGASQEGAGLWQATVRQGRRCSTARSPSKRIRVTSASVISSTFPCSIAG